MTRARKQAVIVLLIAVASIGGEAAPHPAPAGGQEHEITVYKSRLCECCASWVEHMRKHGFRVTVMETAVTERLRMQVEFGIPYTLNSCHLSVAGGYAIQGHVPAEDVLRLLRERPSIVGIAVGGMPAGSPGMESDAPVPFDVIAVRKDSTWVYARHTPERQP